MEKSVNRGNQVVQRLESDLLSRFPTLRLGTGSVSSSRSKLASCVKEIDDFLGGGLPFGEVSEFGMPLGREGRLLLVKFLVNATRGLQVGPLWTLWVSSHHSFTVFPPAWFARGVHPARVVFTQSQNPVRELKRAIVNPLFRLIVLDSPRQFSRDDCLFINAQARLNQGVVILVRDFFLSNKYGNVWAKLRVNCWKRHFSKEFVMKGVRGVPTRQIRVDEELLR